MALTALAALGPLHLETREVIDVAALCEQPGQPTVRLLKGNGKHGRMGLANHLLHPLMEDLTLRLKTCEDESVLHSHLVSREAREALRRGDRARFLSLRKKDLQAYVQRFLDTRAEWEAVDRDRPICCLKEHFVLSLPVRRTSTSKAFLLEALGGDLPGAVIVERGDAGGVEEDAVPVSSESRVRDREPRLKFSLAGVQLKFSV